MNREYAPLAASRLKSGSGFARPTQTLPERVTLESKASDVMTNLRSVGVITVRAKTQMDRANAKMIRYGVRTLLVLDEHEKVAGLITAQDVLGEKPMRFLQEVGGTHSDILVTDVMTPENELEVIKLADVLSSKVGHIIATLKAAGRQHAIVVDEDVSGHQVVCGLFSATQIARQLGLSLQGYFEVARTFAEIEKAIASA
ncbi:CBS domain containing protein [Ferriphaselus amnicola]|jgi:CBS-domain-containing membrane protein|uniref:CBS domain containing protein n=1 Tax=Ferriphaselus amnicola TaxID=1188319 RepID=A0A2Z6GAZ8_9PROT|nr:CBS domain-containing protein [Ferriphaselus amnicola]BBE50606.1 CBS domain containing protein [Ferriphaselus amnicola]